MITMKKKALVAMAMAAAMVAMPVVAGAVTSPGSQSDGTIGQDSSSQSQNNTNTGSQQSNAGSGVNKVAEATVVQGSIFNQSHSYFRTILCNIGYFLSFVVASLDNSCFCYFVYS